MVEQIFLSQQVKQSVVTISTISNKLVYMSCQTMWEVLLEYRIIA